MGIISAKAAFATYAALAALAWFTLEGDFRKYSLLALGLFAFKTYIDILRRRMAEREATEAAESKPDH